MNMEHLLTQPPIVSPIADGLITFPVDSRQNITLKNETLRTYKVLCMGAHQWDLCSCWRMCV